VIGAGDGDVMPVEGGTPAGAPPVDYNQIKTQREA